MTITLYQTDSYLKETECTITEVDHENQGVVLDQTIYFPGGGGQQSDAGVLVINGREIPISKAKRISGKVVHILEELPDGSTPGAKGTLKLDWDRRYKIMRTHTAMHILCGVVYRDYGALVTGGNMEPLKGRMDFEFETLQRELIDEIDAAVNGEVEKALDVKVDFLSRADANQRPELIRTKINLLPDFIKEVRTIEIVGLDLQADGGTHVRNTSEVGTIKIADYKSKGKINKRIYVELAE